MHWLDLESLGDVTLNKHLVFCLKVRVSYINDVRFLNLGKGSRIWCFEK